MPRVRILVLLVLALAISPGCRKEAAQSIHRGNELSAKGSYSEAVIHYRKALQAEPENGEAYYRLGLAELRQGHADEAFAALERASSLLPNRPEPKRELAELCLLNYMQDSRQRRLYDQLRRISQQFLAGDPGSYEGLRYSAYLSLFDRKPEEAIALIARAEVARPGQPATAAVLLRAYLAKGDVAQAERTGLDYLAKDPKYGPLYDALYVLYVQAKREADAEGVLRRKIAAIPAEAGPRLQMAGHFARLQDDPAVSRVLQEMKQAGIAGATLRAGDFYFKLRRYEQAYKEYESGLESDRQNASQYSGRMAECLLASGKSSEAVSAVEQILQATPGNTRPRALRAGLRLSSDNPAEWKAAAEEFQKLAQENQSVAVFPYNLGLAYFRAGRYDLAAPQFKEALRRNRAFYPPLLGLAEIALARRSWAEAEALLTEYSRQQANPRAQYLRARALAGQNKIAESRQLLLQLIGKEPDYWEARRDLAILEARQGRPSEAERLLLAVYKPGGDDLRPLDTLVEVLLQQGKKDRALGLLSAELARAPKRTPVRTGCGNALLRTGAAAQALPVFQALATDFPNVGYYRVRLADCQFALGQSDAAIESLRAAREAEPANPRLSALLGAALERQGRHPEAIAMYRESLKNKGDEVLVANNLAFLLARQAANLDEALDLATRAHKLAPSQPTISDTLGYVLLSRNELDEASKIFQDLSVKYPDDPVYHYHLALTLLKSGQKPLAMKRAEIALKKGPDPVLRSEIERLQQQIRAN